MMTIFSDESHDAHTYALVGCAITPTHWRLFGEEWKAMLGTIAMPNGEPCPVFHVRRCRPSSTPRFAIV